MENKITSETLNQYFKLKENVEDYASDIARFVRDNDLRVINTFTGSIETIEINDSEVDVKFSESWSYSGYDSYDISFPTSYLTLTLDEILKELEPNNKIILERRENHLKAVKEKEHANDLLKFEELKKKLKK